MPKQRNLARIDLASEFPTSEQGESKIYQRIAGVAVCEKRREIGDYQRRMRHRDVARTDSCNVRETSELWLETVQNPVKYGKSFGRNFPKTPVK